jgi:hypothetical protein
MTSASELDPANAADTGHQSLAAGTAGHALLQLERASTGTGTWDAAHTSIRRLTAGPIDGGAHTSLFYGVPAAALVLHCASQVDTRYRSAAARLDAHVLRVARRRLTAAATRRQRGGTASFAEQDLFSGLTGIAALLLRRLPDSDTAAGTVSTAGDVLGDVLRHLVGLTEPRRQHELPVPGWWVDHDPDPTLPTPGGHANLGMAHGAAGLLAVLALALRRGCVVDHHTDAVDRLTAWFDRWRQPDTGLGTWWPQWLTRQELVTGRIRQQHPGRPSWCYGTPGIARALHLAAIATGDPDRQHDAEHILASCLTDQNLRLLTKPGLCHGLAGLYQTVHRAAADATTPALAQRLTALNAALYHATSTAPAPSTEGGLLTGSTGDQLAAHTARHGTPRTGWDTCLLIT